MPRAESDISACCRETRPKIAFLNRCYWPDSEATEQLCAAYASADRIVVRDSDMRDRLMSWGLPRDKFVIVPNWTDTQLVQPVKHDNPFRTQHGLNARFVVMHSGDVGLTQRLDSLVAATAEPMWPAEELLLLVGGRARRDELQSQATSPIQSPLRGRPSRASTIHELFHLLTTKNHKEEHYFRVLRVLFRG